MTKKKLKRKRLIANLRDAITMYEIGISSLKILTSVIVDKCDFDFSNFTGKILLMVNKYYPVKIIFQDGVIFFHIYETESIDNVKKYIDSTRKAILKSQLIHFNSRNCGLVRDINILSKAIIETTAIKFDEIGKILSVNIEDDNDQSDAQVNVCGLQQGVRYGFKGLNSCENKSHSFINYLLSHRNATNKKHKAYLDKYSRSANKLAKNLIDKVKHQSQNTDIEDVPDHVKLINMYNSCPDFGRMVHDIHAEEFAKRTDNELKEFLKNHFKKDDKEDIMSNITNKPVE